MIAMKAINKMSDTDLKALKAKITGKVGERVRYEREKRKLSQEELADLAGFYRTYIGHIETGAYSPSMFTLWRIAQALKIDLSKLVKDL
jgi:transcriptional regulator with XRE-family HTH domain